MNTLKQFFITIRCKYTQNQNDLTIPHTQTHSLRKKLVKISVLLWNPVRSSIGPKIWSILDNGLKTTSSNNPGEKHSLYPILNLNSFILKWKPKIQELSIIKLMRKKPKVILYSRYLDKHPQMTGDIIHQN